MAGQIPKKVRDAMLRGEYEKLRELGRRGAAVAASREKAANREKAEIEAERLRQERMGIA